MIYIKQGDITKATVDCIVNAANKTLLGGGGVDGAIHKAAGKELYKECLTLCGCETGEAKITKGYLLPAKFVIHTVGPVYYGSGDEEEKLKNCYKNSLDLARKNGIHSIAFPSISTGAYGYPKELAVPLALKEMKKWLKINSDYDMEIFVYCFDYLTYMLYNKYIEV